MGRRKLTVATGDDNVEVPPVLALVGSRRLSDGVSVDGALDVGHWQGVLVWASGARVFARIALEEEVETKAELLAVAEGSTFVNAVRVQSLVGQVANLFSRAGFIDERLLVSRGGGCLTGSLPKVVVGVKVSVHGAITRNVLGTSTVSIVSHSV